MISEDIRHHHKGDIEKVGGDKFDVKKPPANPVDEPYMLGKKQEDYTMQGKDDKKPDLPSNEPKDIRDVDTKAGAEPSY